MNNESFIVRVIVSNGSNGLQGQVRLIRFDESGTIDQFRRILNTVSRESALNFALSKGRLIEPEDVNLPIKLTLSKESAIWDLITRKD